MPEKLAQECREMLTVDILEVVDKFTKIVEGFPFIEKMMQEAAILSRITAFPNYDSYQTFYLTISFSIVFQYLLHHQK